jgi:glycine/D-amino acid oxidase-like deaminating enzyme
VTNCGTLRARHVVVGVNAWTDELVPALRGLIVPVRGQAIAYAPLPPTFDTGVVVSATPTDEYWQQTLDGSIVLGGFRAVAPDGDIGVRESTPTQEVTTAIETLFPRLFPHLQGLRVSQRWAGLMAYTADFLPVADAAPGLAGVWFAGGFCGHGMSFAPRLGQLLAQAVTTGRKPAELAPLAADRPTLLPMAAASIVGT